MTGLITGAERRDFRSHVRRESHTAQMRRWTMFDLSTVAWECGFPRGRLVLLTADGARALSARDRPFDGKRFEAMNPPAEMVLRAASACTRYTIGETTDRFCLRLPGETTDTEFTIALDHFGGRRAAVVIGLAGADPDRPLTAQ